MPQDIHFPATNFTPDVDFRFSQNYYALQGECYPENAAAFFGPLIEATEAHLQEINGDPVTLRIQLAYFNSSSTKLIFAWLDRFNTYAHSGNLVTLEWLHDSEDDSIQEFGQELQDDFPAIQFLLVEVS